jgi:hypothetical protein
VIIVEFVIAHRRMSLLDVFSLVDSLPLQEAAENRIAAYARDSLALVDAIFPASLKEVWIAFRIDGTDGSGTLEDPFDGSTARKFDAVMDSLEPNTHIHIGPGVFATRGNRQEGYSGGDGGFYLKAGQKVEGSGINITTIKLVDSPALTASSYYQIFANTRLGLATGSDGIEICHMTLDFNYDHDGNGNISGGFVNLTGDRNWIHHLRIIHWGARANHESFPITNTGNYSTTEFLIFDTPDEGIRANNVSCIFVGSAGQEPNGGVGQYKSNIVVRRCWMNGAKADGSISQHTGISADGLGAVLVEENVITNFWTGGPYRDSWNHKDTLTVRNNYYYNVLTGLYFNLGGQNLHPFSYDYESRPIFTVTNLTSSTVLGSTTVTLDTDIAHGLVADDWFELRGSDPTGFSLLYDGGWQVLTVPAGFGGKRLTFHHPSNVALANSSSGIIEKFTANSVTSMVWSTSGGRQFLEIAAGTNHGVLLGGVIMVGGIQGSDQAIYNIEYGTVYSVTISSFTIEIYGTPSAQPPGAGAAGVWFNRTGHDVKGVSVGGDDSDEITLEVYRNHDVVVGDQLIIQGVRDAAAYSLNGYYLCIRVDDATHFTYKASSAPSGSAAGIRWARKWGVKRTIFEDNVVVLADYPAPNVPWAVGVGSYPYSLVPNFKVFDELVVRRNHISKLNPTSMNRAIGITCDQVANFIVEDNVIDLPDDDATGGTFYDSLVAITNKKCHSRNNRKPDGTLIRPYDWNQGRYLSDLDRTVDSANLLSLLKL